MSASPPSKGHSSSGGSTPSNRPTPPADMDELRLSVAGLEQQMYSLSPPLGHLRDYSVSQDERSSQPNQFSSLLQLLSAPDMASYLAAETDVQTEALPIHLQQLISEAKEEVVLHRTHPTTAQIPPSPSSSPAMARLERLQRHVWAASGDDMDTAMTTLTTLLNNEDELVAVIE